MTSVVSLPLSRALRESTASAHEQAEGSSFVADLLGGRLPLAAYTALVVQNHAVYTALEAVTPRWQRHPVAGPFVLDVLLRLPSLEADLAALLGPEWSRAAGELVQPATVAYVARLQAAAGSSSAAFVAHHYVRYLGDLSGGQIIGRRVHDLFGDVGRSFYEFAAIPRIKPFRDDYRTLLDAVPLDDRGRAALLDEAVLAFELNRAVFGDLAAAFG